MSIGKTIVDVDTGFIGGCMADELLNRLIETFVINNLEANSNIAKTGGILQFYKG